MNRNRIFPVLIFSLLGILVNLRLPVEANMKGGLSNSYLFFSSQTALSESAIGEANCRYGVAITSKHHDWIEYLGAGVYTTFTARGNQIPSNGAERLRLIKVEQDKDNLGNYLPSYSVSPSLTNDGLGMWVDLAPGSMWIIGNEVDRGPDPGQISGGQGDMYSDVYAQAYHEVYHYVKGRDPTASIGNSGLVEMTPGRLQYLNLVWQAYRNQFGTDIPVDFWTLHLYVLPEVHPNGTPNSIANIALGTDPALGISESYDPDGVGPLSKADTCPLDEVYCIAEHDDIDVFAEQVVAMRTWMRDHGQRQKPLILSEYSQIYPTETIDENGLNFNRQRITDFMIASFNYLETATDPHLGYTLDGNRLVQQWLWYSVNTTGPGSSSNLVENDLLSPTSIGQAYKTWVQNQAGYVNLLPSWVSYPIVQISSGTIATATLSVDIRNNGNNKVLAPFTVSFYENAAMTQLIGSIQLPGPDDTFPGLNGCATRPVSVSINWPDLSPGYHPYWVKVDSGGSIEENQEGDNVKTGFVLVNPRQVYGPEIAGGKK